MDERDLIEAEIVVSRRFSLPLQTVRAAVLRALIDVSQMKKEIAAIRKRTFHFVAEQMMEIGLFGGMYFPLRRVKSDKVPAEILFHAENLILTKIITGKAVLRTLQLLSQSKKIDSGVRTYLTKTIGPFYELARMPMYRPGFATEAEPGLAEIENLTHFIRIQVESFVDSVFLRDYKN